MLGPFPSCGGSALEGGDGFYCGDHVLEGICSGSGSHLWLEELAGRIGSERRVLRIGAAVADLEHLVGWLEWSAGDTNCLLVGCLANLVGEDLTVPPELPLLF